MYSLNNSHLCFFPHICPITKPSWGIRTCQIKGKKNNSVEGKTHKVVLADSHQKTCLVRAKGNVLSSPIAYFWDHACTLSYILPWWNVPPLPLSDVFLSSLIVHYLFLSHLHWNSYCLYHLECTFFIFTLYYSVIGRHWLWLIFKLCYFHPETICCDKHWNISICIDSKYSTCCFSFSKLGLYKIFVYVTHTTGIVLRRWQWCLI